MRETEREGAPVRVGAYVVTPIERATVSGAESGGGFFVVALKRPVAVRIAGPDGERLVRLDD